MLLMRVGHLSPTEWTMADTAHTTYRNQTSHGVAPPTKKIILVEALSILLPIPPLQLYTNEDTTCEVTVVQKGQAWYIPKRLPDNAS